MARVGASKPLGLDASAAAITDITALTLASTTARRNLFTGMMAARRRQLRAGAAAVKLSVTIWVLRLS